MIEVLSGRYKEDEKQLKTLLESVERENGQHELIRIHWQLQNDVEIEKIRNILYWTNVYEFFATPNVKITQCPNVPSVIEYREDKVSINYRKLAEFIYKYRAILTFKNNIFAYVDNKYILDGDNIIKKDVATILEKQDVLKLLDTKKIATIGDEVVERIRAMSYSIKLPFPDEKDEDFIFCRNGVLFLENRQLYPHSPFWGNRYVIPVDYNQNANSTFVKDFINSLTDNEEDKKLLYEIPALALLGRVNKAFMLVGSGANGKSTYLTLLKRFLGRENITSISLQELVSSRFKSAELFGKLANIYADIPKTAIHSTGVFKMLTGGDLITVERKFRDPFVMINKALLIFSANELPEVNDQTYAFWRRWVILQFEKVFQEDEEFKRKIENLDDESLSSFLNDVLLAITRIKELGMTKSRKVEEITEFWKKTSNSVYAFVSDCVIASPSDFVTKDEVYTAYVDYCDSHDLVALSKNRFGVEFQRFAKVVATKRKIGGERVYVWLGIKLKKPNEVDVEEATETTETSLATFDLGSYVGGE